MHYARREPSKRRPGQQITLFGAARTGQADDQSSVQIGGDARLGPGPAAITYRDGWPMVVPTCYGFTTDTLYLRGSVASQSLNTAGTPVCATVTLTDGLVLARSVFEHTINYRSAMIYGQPRLVTDPERLAGLRCITEHVAPRQWDYARQPSRKELAAVRLLALPLDEASVKIRTGPPDGGDSPDAALGPWAGELPLAMIWQQPVPDPALPAGITVPAHISSRAGTRADRSTSSKPGRTDT
jgi:uncharacterized protein